MPDKKTFINGIYVREKEFEWGSIHNVAINVESFIEELSKYETTNGYVFINLNKRKEASDKGLTHYTTLDDYKTEKEGLKKSNSSSNPFGEDPDIPF